MRRGARRRHARRRAVYCRRLLGLRAGRPALRRRRRRQDPHRPVGAARGRWRRLEEAHSCKTTIDPGSEQGAEMAIAQETFEHLRTAGLADLDPEIGGTLERELERQRGQIELIASENFTWPAVLEAIGSTPTNKYVEGYPGKRYYGGCEVVDEIEEVARERAKALFGAEHANVQPHAGAQANMAVYFAVLDPGDRVLG